MINRDLIVKLSLLLGLTKLDIIHVYKAYWNAIYELITNLPLKLELSKELFDKLNTCFNIPYLGKLDCSYERYQNIKKQIDYIRRLKNDTSKRN